MKVGQDATSGRSKPRPYRGWIGWRLGTGHGFEGVLGAEGFGGGDEVGTRVEAAEAVAEVADDVIEADAAKADGGFFFAAGSGDDDDGILAVEDGACPGGILAAESDVDAAFEMGGGEFGGVARVEDLGAGGL